MKKIDISLSDGSVVTWTKENDGFDRIALTEQGVLLINGEKGLEEPLGGYMPGVWLSFVCTPADA